MRRDGSLCHHPATSTAGVRLPETDPRWPHLPEQGSLRHPCFDPCGRAQGSRTANALRARGGGGARRPPSLPPTPIRYHVCLWLRFPIGLFGLSFPYRAWSASLAKAGGSLSLSSAYRAIALPCRMVFTHPPHGGCRPPPHVRARRTQNTPKEKT